MEKQQPPTYDGDRQHAQPTAWDPSHQPHDQTRMGYQAAPGQMQATHGMDMHAHQPNPNAAPTMQYCPATGGAHVVATSHGIVGIIIGIVFCPCGLIAIPFDKKEYCSQCNYVIKPSWGG